MRTQSNMRASLIAVITALALVLPAFAQTRVSAPSNPYSLQDDVQLGRQAAQEVESKMRVVRDPAVQEYISEVGQRLASAIPPEFRHPEFRYTFKVIEGKDINAFALPGGFTYINTGLIAAARNEGELAGVMAHEISHVALRHGTANVAKARKYQTLGALGQILGGVLGGVAGGAISAGSQLGFGAYLLKFSREYEKQADILGSQIMARAGYDPRDLASMFRTIEQQGGRGGPEWLSSHPNPGNRYEYITREAEMLNVRGSRYDNGDFNRIKSRITGGNYVAEPVRGSRSGYGGGRPTGRVSAPSSRYQTYRGGNLFSISVPDNWREMPEQNVITFAPEGAYGDYQGNFVFTHGVQVGAVHAEGSNLQQATNALLNALAQGNPRLRRQGGYERFQWDGRNALAVELSNVSEVTGETEVVTVFTTQLRDGALFYLIAVAPQREAGRYQSTFQQILRSVRLNA